MDKEVTLKATCSKAEVKPSRCRRRCEAEVVDVCLTDKADGWLSTASQGRGLDRDRGLIVARSGQVVVRRTRPRRARVGIALTQL